MYDIAVVGAGFAGAVIAERFASIGRKVIVIDERSHFGGNAYDYYNEHNLLVHKYGPHIFHTNDSKVFNYLSRFTQWRPYEHRVLASVEGKLVPIPVNARTLEMLFDPQELANGVEDFLSKRRLKIDKIITAEDSVLSRMGADIYEKFFKHYTEKQWGKHPKQLHASVTARIPIRTNYDDRYFTDKYQAIPLFGYNKLFHNMLNHPNITLVLNVGWQKIECSIMFNRLIYTGPIDGFFGYCYGRLPYRSLQFKFRLHYRERVQPVATINYPNEHEYTRITEFKHVTGQRHPWSITVAEIPCSSGEPYYPVPTDESDDMLRNYQKQLKQLDTVRFIGRLGTYRYYNMDQVVASALHQFEQLVKLRW